MNAEEVYVGQVVKYKEWEDLSERWEADEVGDLWIVDSAGNALCYVFRYEVDSLCGVELVVTEIEEATEGCFVLLNGINLNDQVESFWVHCYKLDPVEQEDFSFDETGFLNMLGVKGREDGGAGG